MLNQELGNLSRQWFKLFLGIQAASWWANTEIAGTMESLVPKWKEIHFLQSHLANFSENCGDVSDEQVKRFHQDIKRKKDIKDIGIKEWW